MYCITHQDDTGGDEKPARSPPQPENETLFSNHHLNVFNKTVRTCNAWGEYIHHVHSGSLKLSHLYVHVSPVMIFTVYVADTDDLQESQKQQNPAASKLVNQSHPVYSCLSQTHTHVDVLKLQNQKYFINLWGEI